MTQAALHCGCTCHICVALQVVVRRDRLCIPVRRGRQGELPKGSVTLATSESGNTLYIEPQVQGPCGWALRAREVCLVRSSSLPRCTRFASSACKLLRL